MAFIRAVNFAAGFGRSSRRALVCSISLHIWYQKASWFIPRWAYWCFVCKVLGAVLYSAPDAFTSRQICSFSVKSPAARPAGLNLPRGAGPPAPAGSSCTVVGIADWPPMSVCGRSGSASRLRRPTRLGTASRLAPPPPRRGGWSNFAAADWLSPLRSWCRRNLRQAYRSPRPAGPGRHSLGG